MITKEYLQKIFDAQIKEHQRRPSEGKRVTALIVEPNRVPYVKEIGADYGTLFCLLGGPLEGICPYGDPVSILGNEYGKVLGLTPNRALFGDGDRPYDVIAGTFIVVGAEEDSEEYSSLTDEMIKKYSEMFGDPVCRWRYVL